MGEPRALTDMHRYGILMHMRTTLNIDSTLLSEAAKLTGVTEKTALVRMGLQALIARESARRLARLGGTEKRLSRIRRRRPGRAA
jgi:Arc/MetJ family transcription regulator